MQNILIIGDSISEGYIKTVEELLKGKANVSRIQENGRHTDHSLKNLDTYLGDKKWSIIHFNWGLWDMRHEVKKDGKITYAIPIEKYKTNLLKLIKKLKATGAKLIWATTTPVLWDESGKGRTNPDVIRYNAAALKIMKKNGIAIDDLYAIAKPRLDELQSKLYETDVHYTEKGYAVLGDAVTQSIQTIL